jgi:hypothetical protein
MTQRLQTPISVRLTHHSLSRVTRSSCPRIDDQASGNHCPLGQKSSGHNPFPTLTFLSLSLTSSSPSPTPQQSHLALRFLSNKADRLADVVYNPGTVRHPDIIAIMSVEFGFCGDQLIVVVGRVHESGR